MSLSRGMRYVHYSDKRPFQLGGVVDVISGGARLLDQGVGGQFVFSRVPNFLCSTNRKLY